VILRREVPIDDGSDPAAADEMDGVENPVSWFSPGFTPLSHEPGPPGTRQLHQLALAENLAKPLPTERESRRNRSQSLRHATVTCELLDAAISHLYRAGVLINMRNEVAGAAAVDELKDVTDEIDTAIRQIQKAALENP